MVLLILYTVNEQQVWFRDVKCAKIGKSNIFPGSSMVEQEAVNFEVAGSSPAPGAKPLHMPHFVVYYFNE
jgi:hypothetical protein